MPIPFARAVDPSTGDRLYDARRRTWVAATSNEEAIVRAVLATPLGSAARDLTYGVESVDNAAANAAARWRMAVLKALSRWIQRGVLNQVTVEVDPTPVLGGTALNYAVTFLTARGAQGTVPGTL